MLEYKYIQKSHQWCILNKKHSELIINNDIYIYWFNYRGTDPNEDCYITFLYYLNPENEIITTPNSANDATTFTNRKGMNYKYPSSNDLKIMIQYPKNKLNIY